MAKNAYNYVQYQACLVRESMLINRALGKPNAPIVRGKTGVVGFAVGCYSCGNSTAGPNPALLIATAGLRPGSF